MNAVDEIKHLYHNTTKATIQRDLTRAITLLKTLTTEDERERVAVYMDGLSQMRSEWGVRPSQGSAQAKAPASGRTARPAAPAKRRSR
jgi:hypothetical protein